MQKGFTLLNFSHKNLGGFTLIELLIVVGIVGILSVVVVSTINPAEILKQSRDAKRLAEIKSIDGAVEFALSQNLGLNIGSSTTIYLSLPDSDQGCGNYPGLPQLELPWVYRCAPESSYRNIDGVTGWLPVNFASLSTSPFTALPVDPKNDGDLGLYYSYIPQGSKWELNVEMESKKFSFNGSGDVESEDGGNTIIIYEAGNDLNLAPREVSSRLAGTQLLVPENCADADSLILSFSISYITNWTIPGEGEAIITDFWFWPRNKNMTDHTQQLALYEGNTSGARRLTEVVDIKGDSTNWVSGRLASPVSISLGQTYAVGITVKPGNSQIYAQDNNAATQPACVEYQPNAGSKRISGLTETLSTFGVVSYRVGIFGISYVER